MRTKTEVAHAEVANALGELSRLFSKECVLTFVMRHPTDKECYMVIGDDKDFDTLVETIRRAQQLEGVAPKAI